LGSNAARRAPAGMVNPDVESGKVLLLHCADSGHWLGMWIDDLWLQLQTVVSWGQTGLGIRLADVTLAWDAPLRLAMPSFSTSLSGMRMLSGSLLKEFSGGNRMPFWGGIWLCLVCPQRFGPVW
jgi:hypothetical protein